MPVHRPSFVVSRLAAVTASMMFALIVVGSIVRTTGSGLACPDWPLCQGRLIPPLQFNVLVEWFHRLLALVVGLSLFATAATVALDARTRRSLGGLALLAVALYFTQALLGALTVWRLLDPTVVSGHLAVALLLFATLLTLALVAHHDATEATPATSRPAGSLAVLVLTCVFVYAQAVLGGVVSTHAAGLACPDWPTCNGDWFPPLRGLVGLQMAHRYGAYLLTAWLALVAFRLRGADDPILARVGVMLLGATIGQVSLGICNVLLGIPVWLTALHLANAAGLLALSVAAAFRAAILPARAEILSMAAAS